MSDNLHSFFIVVPLNFEKVALKELKEKWNVFYSNESFPEHKAIRGGIELITSLEIGLSLNYILKIPSKILLRLTSFKCRDFPKLYNKILKIKWGDYFIGQRPQLAITSHKSLLINTSKVKKTIEEAFEKYYIGSPPKKNNLKLIKDLPPTILNILIDNDLVTLSLNTSGELLYKRGIKKLINEAPIRENIASGLLQYLKEKINFEYSYLIDPMCGSGTFLLEDITYFEPNYDRAYSFEHFPIYKKLAPFKINEINNSNTTTYLGLDSNKTTIKNTTKTLSQFKQVQLSLQDLFDKTTNHINPSILITNPPYGKRITINDPTNFFNNIIRSSFDKFDPKIAGFIIPDEQPFYLNRDFKVIDKISFSNGGTKVTFYILKRKTR